MPTSYDASTGSRRSADLRGQPRRNLRRSVTTAGAKISTAPTSSAGTLSTQAKNVGVITDTTRSTPASLSCRLVTAADAISAEADPTTQAVKTGTRASALTAPSDRSPTVNPITAHTIDPMRTTCRSSKLSTSSRTPDRIQTHRGTAVVPVSSTRIGSYSGDLSRESRVIPVIGSGYSGDRRVSRCLVRGWRGGGCRWRRARAGGCVLRGRLEPSGSV